MDRTFRRAVRWVEPGLIAVGLAACNTNSSPTINDGCGPTNACAAGLVCGYPVNAGCMSGGSCVPVFQSGADCVPMVACGCFGGTVSYGCNFYPGYAPASIALTLGLDECTDAGEGGLASDGAVGVDGAVEGDSAAAGDGATGGDGAGATDGGAPGASDAAAAGDGAGATDGGAPGAGDGAADAGDGGP